MMLTLDELEYENPYFSRYRYEAPKTTGGGGCFIRYIYPEVQGTPPTMQGWECPKCSRVYSPWVKGCRRCNDRVEEKELYCKVEGVGEPTTTTNAAPDPSVEYSYTT